MNEIVPLKDTVELAGILAKSGFFQDSRDAAQAVVKVLAGRELGFGAIASMCGIYIVKGKVTLSANLIAAAIKRSGVYNYRIKRLDDNGCEVAFFENGQEVGVSKFDKSDATKAGLSGDNWNKYPRNMMFARAISNGAKWYTPDIFGGPVYTPDELGAMVDGETGEIIEVEVERPEPEPQPEHTNGDSDAKKQWFAKVLEELPYYGHIRHVANTLKSLGYSSFTEHDPDEMFAALEAHAKKSADEEAA